MPMSRVHRPSRLVLRAALAAVLPAACATAPYHTPPGHPARPDAPAATATPASDTLTVGATPGLGAPLATPTDGAMNPTHAGQMASCGQMRGMIHAAPAAAGDAGVGSPPGPVPLPGVSR